MLSDNFSAKLGGGYTILQVFPFSFAEFYQFTETGYATKNVEKYLLAGGMPEVLKVHDEEQRVQLISDIINSTVEHDIVSRYNPSNPNLTKCSVPLQKNNVDNKTRFSCQEGYCLCSWVLQYVVLQLKPVHNSPFSNYPH